ncbi:MAG: MFS transporter [Pseudomonadota bacterium]
MLRVLRQRPFADLLCAQVVALLGTGLLTIALGLLAFDLAGDQAGVVLGTALAIKMVAYVCLAPVASAVAERLSRKTLLVGADLIRASVALGLPFIDAVWQVYVLIFVLQAASAAFTPAFQATIPDVLPDEEDYTNALSLSRLASELENLISPLLAGLLLQVISFHWLFAGTILGFLASALLVLAAPLPPRTRASATRSFAARLTRGVRIYAKTPRLRGLLGLSLSVASVGAFVIVNTVVMVRAGYGRGDPDVAYALAAFGAGSMVAALSMPRLLGVMQDRQIMIPAAAILSLLALGHAAAMLAVGLLPWPVFLALWLISGMCFSAIITPSGRLLTRSAHAEDRPAVFAAQFALSHACWLVAYPLAGWVGSLLGLATALALLGAMGLLGVLIALRNWPAGDPVVVAHSHPDLPADHPHLTTTQGGRNTHAHPFIIDDQHPSWPSAGA